MLSPGDIIYGFAKNLRIPKPKYAISIYRDEEVNIVMQFTTSQPRSGVLDEKEYIDLVYAMYRSNRTKPEYKPYLDRILTDYYKDK